MKKILVPIEQNPESKEIIEEAVEIAKKIESRLILFNVNDSKERIRKVDTGGFIDRDRLYERIKDTSLLEEIKKMYEAKGVNVEIITQEGDPASAIIDEAEKGKYDLVIMKSHTLKKRRRFLLGSVTNKVVHHIKVPILVVR